MCCIFTLTEYKHFLMRGSFVEDLKVAVNYKNVVWATKFAMWTFFASTRPHGLVV